MHKKNVPFLQHLLQISRSSDPITCLFKKSLVCDRAGGLGKAAAASIRKSLSANWALLRRLDVKSSPPYIVTWQHRLRNKEDDRDTLTNTLDVKGETARRSSKLQKARRRETWRDQRTSWLKVMRPTRMSGHCTLSVWTHCSTASWTNWGSTKSFYVTTGILVVGILQLVNYGYLDKRSPDEICSSPP